MTLADLINLERLEILDQDEHSYTVNYSGKEYEIVKSDTSCFNSASASSGMRLCMKQQQLLEVEGIFQDEDVPEEYKEVMMFHEIRESQYAEVDFEDAHERAVNDEILYVMKFLGEERLEDYLSWVQDYRKDIPKEIGKKLIGIWEPFEEWTKECDFNGSWDDKYKAAARAVEMSRSITPEDLDDFLRRQGMTERIMNQNNYSQYRDTPLFICAAVNALPEGEVSVTLPNRVIEANNFDSDPRFFSEEQRAQGRKDAREIVQRMVKLYLTRPDAHVEVPEI